MAHPWHHAVRSAKLFGGVADDYLAIHNWFDESKAFMPDLRHRALRHHAEGIFLCEKILGVTVRNSAGKEVPVRTIGEQHIKDDLGWIPTVQDWLSNIKIEPWMIRTPFQPEENRSRTNLPGQNQPGNTDSTETAKPRTFEENSTTVKTPEWTAMLCFRPDGTFTITQFTDLHYRNGDKKDADTLRVMRRVLDVEPTDLVVLSGDVIDGSFCRDPIQSYAEAVGLIVDRGLAWAAVFGNHDDEGSASRMQLMASLQRLPGCLASTGPAKLSGVGNYALPVMSGDRVAAVLYFIDSHAYDERARKEYDWIKQDQIDWYLQTSAEYRKQNGGQPVPSLMFFHIPLPEFDDLWTSGGAMGAKNEKVCCARHNSGMFAAIKSAGDLLGVFVGHDHTNDFTGPHEGVRLCYGRATGFGSYGKTGFPRGARMIRLRAGALSFETWLCLDCV